MEIFGNHSSQAQTLEWIQAEGLRTVLLTGPSHIGKMAFLKASLQAWIESSDLLIVEPSITGTRSAVKYCETSPLFSPFRAVLVDEADKLSDAAQDAFLKLCEEPPDTARLFFVVEDEGHLLPALLSRMESVVKWTTLSEEEMGSFIEGHSVAEDPEARKLCFGRPGLYSAMVGNTGYANLRKIALGFLMGHSNPLSDPVPGVVSSLKSGASVERDLVSFICRRVALSVIGEGSAPRLTARRLLEYSSLLTKVPSSNAEIHWKATFLTPSV